MSTTSECCVIDREPLSIRHCRGEQRTVFGTIENKWLIINAIPIGSSPGPLIVPPGVLAARCLARQMTQLCVLRDTETQLRKRSCWCSEKHSHANEIIKTVLRVSSRTRVFYDFSLLSSLSPGDLSTQIQSLRCRTIRVYQVFSVFALLLFFLCSFGISRLLELSYLCRNSCPHCVWQSDIFLLKIVRAPQTLRLKEVFRDEPIEILSES